MFKSKKLVALGLAAVALFSTVGVSLAYWASSVTGASNTATGTINVGTGDAVTTQVNVSNVLEGNQLVPPGFADEGDEVETVTLTFAVSWNDTDGDADGAVGTLAATRGTYTVGGLTDTDGLVNISANPANVSITAGAAALNVSYTVTLDEPTNKAQYDFVAGKAIVINFSFVVTVA